jgi:hypothetical protein
MGGNMKLFSLLTIIMFLMTTLGEDSMADIKRAADNAAFQQQEDVALLEFLYEVGNTYDCFFTVEAAWQGGEPSNQVEATRIEKSLSKTNLRNALNSLQQAAPNLIYMVSRENPRIIHIIDSRLTRQNQYGLEAIVKRVDFTGTVGELVDELNRMGVSIQRPAMMDIHEARLMNSQTKVKVAGQGLKVRGILSNYIPLGDHGRILWIARTRLAPGEISSIQFRR